MAEVKFESHLDEVLKATSEQLARAAEIIGGMAESYAKKNISKVVYATPAGWYVRTGNLRNSITHTTENNGHTGVIGSAVTYAPYIELGTGKYAEGGGGRPTPWRYQDSKGNWHTTSGMKPRPYLRPAIEDHKREYKEVVEEELKRG